MQKDYDKNLIDDLLARLIKIKIEEDRKLRNRELRRKLIEKWTMPPSKNSLEDIIEERNRQFFVLKKLENEEK